jgi:hypothetical protein
MQLVAGQRSSVQVGELPRAVAKHLKCEPGVVYLGHKEVVKIVRKHGTTVRVEQLQCLPFAIHDGEYRADPARNGPLTIYYRDGYDDHLYVIGLKSACKGGEVWIRTLFLCSEDNVRNQRERAMLLRNHLQKK